MKVNIEEISNWQGGLNYCRRIPAGYDKNEPLEMYRGNVLAYTIKSILWGASHRITEESDGGLRIRKYEKFPGDIF